MKSYALEHLADSTLLHDLDTLDARDRGTTAALLAHLGEVDARKLYLPVGFPSMYAYCVGHRKYSEDIAYKRIRAARAARRFPVIFTMLAEGRLHLSGVVLLAPYLIEDTAADLLTAAVHKTKAEIEQLLAARFPKPDVPPLILPVAATTYACQLAPGPVELGTQTGETLPAGRATEPSAARSLETPTEAVLAPPPGPPVPVRVDPPVSRPRMAPLAPARFALQVTIDQETHDLLQAVQDLLGHDVPPGDMEAVLKYALQTAKQKLEQRKFAATERPRASHQPANPDGRHIPAEVRRAVRQRDGGQCTFRSDTGHRCEERKALQFDHVEPYAQGGVATIGGIRLLCRAHNQFEAERTFGAEFMRHKREAARIRASEVGARGPSATQSAG
jgi:hypothetical protein